MAEMPEQLSLQRDGTSRSQRRLTVLAPDYVAVDEHTLKDWLAFGQAYARELRYYDLGNDAAGDWSAFLDMNLDTALAFMTAPDHFSDEQSAPYRRPHRVLFLTFLHLLQQAQEQLNTLTGRHLDFYYRQVLRLQKQPALPDHVNVLIEPAADTESLLVPAGTLLDAGKDSLGQDLTYRTDREIVINQAHPERLSSLYVEKRVTGIREAREQYSGPRDEAIIAMLRIVLGEPDPGDPLPPYPPIPPGQVVDYPFLQKLYRLLHFTPEQLYLPFQELRRLMQLKRQRDRADPEWNQINTVLEKAGQNRTKDPAYRLQPSDPRDFDANLVKALGGPLDFSGLREVRSIYDLYDQRIRQDVQQFIQDHIHLSMDDFVSMMQLKVRIDNEWREINTLLEQAGSRKRNTAYQLPISDYSSPAFTQNLNAALGTLDFSALSGIASLDDYYAAVIRVEAYFFMAAEDFVLMMATAEKTDAPSQEWDKVYAKLAVAYREKVYAARRAILRNVRESQGYPAMLRLALGEASTTTPDDRLVDSLHDYVGTAADFNSLKQFKPDAATQADWDRIYHIVELAWRNRQGLGEPVARKEEWLNLHAATDATTIKAADGAASTAPRWHTFGQRQASVDKSNPPTTPFGWMFSSPLLLLSQGQRTLTLTLGFQPEQFAAEKINALLKSQASPFRIQFSSADGWLEPATSRLESGDYGALIGVKLPDSQTLQALRWTLTLDERTAALAPLPAADTSVASSWPLLRLLLQPHWEEDAPGKGHYRTPYQEFRNLMLSRVHLQVEVNGLTDMLLENDEATLDPKKPFEPFGGNPVVGSRFYLAHSELVCKKLDSLTFVIDWMGAPADLAANYKNYPVSLGNASFTARISLLDQHLELALIDKASLFNSADASTAHTISIPKDITADSPIPDITSTIHQKSGLADYAYERDVTGGGGAEIKDWRRYLQWELNTPDFQHGNYPAVATAKSIALATAIATAKTGDAQPKPEDYQVKPPYTPKIKSLRLGYTASLEILLQDYQPGAAVDRLFHQQPFGCAELQPEPATGWYRFLPRYDNEGELYIGLRGLQPPQNLNLLLQLAEGSANPDLEPAPVEWSYLNGNRWLSLHNGNILADTTRGLLNSGIIEFQLLSAQPNSLLPAELYWLRVAIPQRADSVCDTIAIHTQAVAATLATQNPAPDHLLRPLPAGTIKQPLESLPAIERIVQPYTSYGGKPAEQDSAFYTRVSERLRHKYRAITLWDYEHLLLEQFPQLYKVKCLPAALSDESDEPGRVDIIVIPDIRERLPFTPFEPKASASLLSAIADFLADYTPPFATIKVKNAHYQVIKLRFGVRFLPGRDSGFYKQQLNEELNHFLAPWAYEEGADIIIGGKLYANVIIDFIERRPYVDYVAIFRFFSSEDGVEFRPVDASQAGGYRVEATRPDSVLVPAREHEIDLITEAHFVEETFSGINYMKIELDFIVG